MQRKRNGQIVGVKPNIKTGERSKHATIVGRKVTLDQIAEQNHNNQEMTQGGTMVMTTRENPSMEHVIIVGKRDIDSLNVEPGSIT